MSKQDFILALSAEDVWIFDRELIKKHLTQSIAKFKEETMSGSQISIKRKKRWFSHFDLKQQKRTSELLRSKIESDESCSAIPCMSPVVPFDQAKSMKQRQNQSFLYV